MAVGTIGRILGLPLILLNLGLAIVILGLAGRVLDRGISGQSQLSGFQGNGATPYLVLFALIAAMVCIASYLAGLHHLRVWRGDSGSAAHGAAWIAWLLLILAFCLAWKEIHIGGHRGVKLKVLEAFIIILTFTHFLYTVLAHLGGKNRHDNVVNTTTVNNTNYGPTVPAVATHEKVPVIPNAGNTGYGENAGYAGNAASAV